MPKITAPTLQAHREETIERLLDAWGELVMARTAIYNYFPDKETLLFTWTDREVERTLTSMIAKIQEAGSSAEKLRVAVRLQLESFQTRHLPPGQEVMQLLRRDAYERFMQHIEPLEAAVRKIIEEGAERGEFDPGLDPAATVPMVLACVGAERVPLSTRQHDLDEATERVTSFLLRALGAGTKRAKRG
jgi:AcrR family transcriptional regulator